MCEIPRLRCRMIASICAITSAAVPEWGAVARADDLPNLSRVIVCKLIKDDVERLHCYDRALREAPAGAPSQGVPDSPNAARSVEGNWQVSEGKSSTDGTPTLTAVLEALGGKAALIVRCQHQRTEVYVTVQSYVGAAQPLPVTYTINDGPPIETRWLPAQEGQCAFCSDANRSNRFRSLASGAGNADAHGARFHRTRPTTPVQAGARDRTARQDCCVLPMAGIRPSRERDSTVGSRAAVRKTDLYPAKPTSLERFGAPSVSVADECQTPFGCLLVESSVTGSAGEACRQYMCARSQILAKKRHTLKRG